MSLESHMQRAPRAKLVNTRNGKSQTFQFNPTEWEEALGCEFSRQVVPGLSHTVMQFINTRNREVSVELYYDNANYKAGTLGTNPILYVRRWLRSLVYPRKAGGRVTGGAPRVLFVWPGFLSFTAFVVDLTLTYVQFNKKGEPSAMRIELMLEEVRDEMLFSEDARTLEGE